MTKYKNLLATILLVLQCVQLQAHDFWNWFGYQKFYFNIISNTDHTVELTAKSISATGQQVNLYSGYITLPSTVNYNGQTYTVTRLGSALSYCQDLKYVTIPETITEFSKDAFSGCKSLPVKNGIRYADWVAVGAIDKTCTTYEIDGKTKAIMCNAFSGCKNLKVIELPDNVRTICSSAFQNCTALENVKLPEGLLTIEEKSFYNCTSLTNINIPRSVTTISDYAFYGCSSLKEISLSESLKTIGNEAFSRCSSLRHIVIPKDVINIKRAAFYDCTNLFSVSILSSAISYDANVFESCSSVEHLQLPSGIGDIPTSSLNYCSRITSIYLPKSLNCITWSRLPTTSLKKILYEGTEEEWNSIKHYGKPNGLVVLYNQEKPDVTYFSHEGVDYAIAKTGNQSVEVAGCLKADNLIISYPIEIDGNAYFVTSIEEDFFRYNPTISCVKFKGTKSQWEKIDLKNNASYLSKIKVVYYYDEEAEDAADKTNYLYVDNSSNLTVGSSNSVYVKMKNDHPIAGFQFELELPDNMSLDMNGDYYAVQLSNTRTSSQMHNIFEVSRLRNGRYLVMCSSSTNRVFSDNDGEVLELKLTVNDSTEVGDYVISLYNIAMSSPNAKVERTKKLNCAVDVTALIPGNADGDKSVTPDDVNTLTDYLLGNTPEHFSIKAADVNKDGQISIEDLTRIIDILINPQSQSIY